MDGLLLQADGLFPIRHHRIDGDGDVEEGDLLERTEAAERGQGILGELLHDAPSDRGHEAVEGPHVDADLQRGAAVELAEAKTLLDVLPAIIAGDHRDEMGAFEQPDLLEQLGPARQPAPFLELGDVIEEGRQMLVQMIQDRRLHLTDPH